MKTLLLLLAFSTIAVIALPQQKNPTSVKEINERQKQAEEALKNLTPEQRKMMEQLGIGTSVPALPKGTTDAQVALAVGGDAVPKKNMAFINAIPKTVLTMATVGAYMTELNTYVEKGVSDNARDFGKQVYAALKKNKYTASEIGNAAMSYWITGNLDLAVYLMSKACADNASDAELQSNYAAMISMGGAPHRAIPLLEYLNKQYPDNTTILNNLGQAWFYLGETDKAMVHLDKVVKAFAYHPQANYTQCLILESKGNKTQAIQKLKNSLAYSYSLNKVNKLQKMGYSVKGKDMRKPFRPDPNPLGLRNFTRPDVPASYTDELKLMVEWDAFQKQVNARSMELAKELIPYQQANAQQAEQLLKQYQKDGVSGMKATKAPAENLYRKIATKNLEEMNKDGGATYRLKKAKASIDSVFKNFLTKDESQRKAIEKASSTVADGETELAKKGENIGFDNCVVQQKYSEWVYANYNKPLEEAYKNYIHLLYIKITEELYWRQFTQDAAQFEATKIAAKKEWLEALGNTRYIATNRYGKCETPPQKEARYKLAKFDELHCAYKSELDAKVVLMKFECGKSSISFDAGRVSGDFNFEFDDAGNSNLKNGTVELTAIDKSVSAGKGPLQVGASVKAGMGIEFTSKGIEDVYATGEAKVNIGSNTVDDPLGVVNDPSMNVFTASGRMSLISGNMSGGITGFGK